MCDSALREDAQQRATAAEERAQAMRLREQAERPTEDAGDRLAQREARRPDERPVALVQAG